jgi:hypothetical protein
MQRNILVIYLLLVSMGVYAQTPDRRVTERLNQLNFKYDVKEDGTFQFTIPVGSRSQIIYIHSVTNLYDKIELREVYSVVHQSKIAPDAARLQRLLIDNSQKKLGAWELVLDGGTYFVIFTAKISADMDASDMKSVIDIVATSSDSMEKELFTVDEW